MLTRRQHEGPAYAPHGAVKELKFSNGLWEHSNFNNRLQPTQIGLGTTQGGTQKLGLTFTYGTTSNSGNVLTQTITPPGITALTQTYTYDPLNRIATAAESNGTTTWSRTYGYDHYGNRAVTGWSGISLPAVTPKLLTDFSTASNRITMANTAYDPAGNLTTTHLTEALAYDAENRQTSYTGGSSSGTYFYDGGGNRVKKVSTESGTTKTQIFVYDAFGKLAAEYSDRAPSSPGTHYRTVDHLGSTRLVTDGNQADKARYDLLPFGEEIFAGVGGRSGVVGYGSMFDHRHKFTGKERDSESGMDYFLARYYSSSMARFLSVDPGQAGAKPGLPQTWNGYTYVLKRATAPRVDGASWDEYATGLEDRLDDLHGRVGRYGRRLNRPRLGLARLFHRPVRAPETKGSIPGFHLAASPQADIRSPLRG